ncbi:endothelin-converting enzyme 1-like [Protopterus annectens]|uniref:endothelin-converting enzyme 1-like n=1 Tax=Protopterus annectens TaxID=7888 RepID=UPI001CFA40D3|nr:endothelin-converting enzyme 1-like [Protopterus annectens]
MVEKVTIFNNQQVSFQEVENNKSYIRWWRRPKNVIICGILLVLIITAGMYTIYSVWICRKEPPTCQTEACQTVSAQLLRNLNQSMDPCEDFFSFSCGKWVSAHPVPPGKQKITVYDSVWENNQEILKMLLEEPDAIRTSAEEKAVKFYRSCMNTRRIEELGSEPIADLIEKVGGWSLSGHWNKSDLNHTLMALMRDYQTFPFFTVYTGSNPLDPHSSIIQIDQPEFWMLSQNKDKNYAETLRVIVQYLQSLAELAGKEKGVAERYVHVVFAYASIIERLATSRQIRIEEKMLFQMKTIQDLQKEAPFFDWLAYLNALFYPIQLNELQPVYIHDLPYIKSMSTHVQKSHYYLTNIYMILYLIHKLAPSLDSRYGKAIQKLMVQLSDTEMVSLYAD